MTILADNIALLVARAGGQTELSEIIGASQSAVSRWLDGVVPRNLNALDAAARYAGCTADELRSIPLSGVRRPRADNTKQIVLMPVSLPSEERLAAMFRGLLRAVGLEDQAAEHAGTLAQRLPDALAQAAADLLPEASSEETIPGERSRPLAKRDPDLRQ